MSFEDTPVYFKLREGGYRRIRPSGRCRYCGSVVTEYSRFMTLPTFYPREWQSEIPSGKTVQVCGGGQSCIKWGEELCEEEITKSGKGDRHNTLSIEEVQELVKYYSQKFEGTGL